jgi:hypothetical protein
MTERPLGLIAVPCSGSSKLGIPNNHFYRLEQLSSRRIVGFVTPEQLAERMTRNSKIIMGGSHTQCIPCSMSIEGFASLEEYEQDALAEESYDIRRSLLKHLKAYRKHLGIES